MLLPDQSLPHSLYRTLANCITTMALKSNCTILLLLVAFLLSACAAPSTDRVKDKDPVKCFWVRASDEDQGAQRLAIINQEIDMRSDPSNLQKGEVSRLENDAMEIFIAELEGKGFFQAAKPGTSSRKMKYVSLHIPSGDYYVELEWQPNVYKQVAQAFMAYFNYGDTRFMTGSATGEAPVDFEKQKDDLLRSNQEQRAKKR